MLLYIMTTNIYILSLQGGNYYVGKSTNVYSRYQEHLDGNGCAWTKRFKPISLVKTLENVSPFEEDKITKEYMAKYGIDKVRGGSYIQTDLDAVQREALSREIRMAKDLCNRCGRDGHFVKDCYARTNMAGDAIGAVAPNTYTNKLPRIQLVTKAVARESNNACYRCGRQGHYSPDCYASTHAMGYDLDSDSDSDSYSDSDSDY